MRMKIQSGQTNALLALIRNGKPMTLRQQLHLSMRLSIPAVIAQLSSIIMQYIDAAMVGHLGAEASASIGFVSTTTWLPHVRASSESVSKPFKSINKSFIFKNRTFGFKNKTFIFENKTFIYRLIQANPGNIFITKCTKIIERSLFFRIFAQIAPSV